MTPLLRIACLLGGSLLLLPACSDDATMPPTAAPSINQATASLNPNNALSALLAIRSQHADSARILYRDPGGAVASTPFVPLSGSGEDTLATLGLLPGTAYRNVVEVAGPGGTARSDTVAFTSGALPAELQTVHFDVTGSVPSGYTLTSLMAGSNGYTVAFDSLGEIRWYWAADPGIGVAESKQQLNGNITTFVGNSFGWQPVVGRYVEVTPAGTTVRTYAAGGSFYTDGHELLLTFRNGQVDRAHLFGYDLRTTDLTSIGGQAGVLLAGHQLLRQTPAGITELVFNGWDHFTLADWIEEPASQKALANVDLDHPNSLDFDLDGNYIVSWRNLAEITKIDARSGAVIWRLGGRNNQFTILNDPLGGFNGEHCVRVLDNGHLLLYDNGLRHLPPETRAAEYVIDPVGRTATLIWEYRHTPPLFTPFTGSVQRLVNGNTFVGFVGIGHATEVRSDGSVVWEGDFKVAGQVVFLYRALRIGSLYRYVRP